MMMEQRCPYCGSERLDFRTFDDEPVSENEIIRTWDVSCCNCGRGHGGDKGFIVSEVLTVTSRLVAKDEEELDGLIRKETEEDE